MNKSYLIELVEKATNGQLCHMFNYRLLRPKYVTFGLNEQELSCFFKVVAINKNYANQNFAFVSKETFHDKFTRFMETVVLKDYISINTDACYKLIRYCYNMIIGDIEKVLQQRHDLHVKRCEKDFANFAKQDKDYTCERLFNRSVAVKLIGISYRKAGKGWHFVAFGPDYKQQSNKRPVLKLTNENKWKIIQFYENTFTLNNNQSDKIIKLITAMIIENQAELM